MVSQATINGQPRIDETAAQVGENVANLATELLTLAELQGKLALLDLEESGAQAVQPAATLVGGAGLVLGAVPVLLLGITWFLDRMTTLTLDGAAAVVALVAITVGVVCIGTAYVQLKQAFRCLNRSREEFQANVRWIKQAIQHSSQQRRFPG